MASTSPVNGLPTVELNTNASGSGGRVLIKDGSTIVYEFTNSRQLKTPGGPMELTGALNVDNTFLEPTRQSSLSGMGRQMPSTSNGTAAAAKLPCGPRAMGSWSSTPTAEPATRPFA